MQSSSKQHSADMNCHHEDGWCPVTCPLGELETEIARLTSGTVGFDCPNYGQIKFLEGVRHTRIVVAAATGGRVGG